MSQYYPALCATLARINDLIAGSGRDRDEVLNAAELARRTALPVAHVQTLLNGGQVPDDDIEQRVCARVHALYQARIAETGKRPADIRQEIAEHLQRSHEWVRRLCNGEKTPSVRDLHGLRGYFGIGDRFLFTASAADTLNGALQATLRMLEATEDNLLVRVMREFDQVLLARRGKALTEQEKSVITSYVTAVLDAPA